MPILCNGTLVQDIRLARVEQFDDRSKNYPIRSLVGGVTPRSYTWSCLQWLDQGNEGACVGFAMTHELVARPSVVPDLTPKFAREEVYWEAQKIDPWDGGAYPGAAPFYEGTSVLAGIKVLQKLGYVSEYRWAFSIQDLVLAVGHCGPAILGIPWYDGMFDPYPCGHLHVGGSVAGGHAILCNAVSIKDRTFNLHNSWGKAWGFQGDAKISWDELDRLLHEGGEAVIPVSRHLL
jgi:hypothetical protein